jgi:hypothetical protein
MWKDFRDTADTSRHDLESRSRCLNNSHAIGFREGGIEENMTLNQKVSYVTMVYRPKELYPISKLFTDLFNDKPFGSVSSNVEIYLRLSKHLVL